jgi:hypothetical protein
MENLTNKVIYENNINFGNECYLTHAVQRFINTDIGLKYWYEIVYLNTGKSIFLNDAQIKIFTIQDNVKVHLATVYAMGVIGSKVSDFVPDTVMGIDPCSCEPYIQILPESNVVCPAIVINHHYEVEEDVLDFYFSSETELTTLDLVIYPDLGEPIEYGEIVITNGTWQKEGILYGTYMFYYSPDCSYRTVVSGGINPTTTTTTTTTICNIDVLGSIVSQTVILFESDYFGPYNISFISENGETSFYENLDLPKVFDLGSSVYGTWTFSISPECSRQYNYERVTTTSTTTTTINCLCTIGYITYFPFYPTEDPHKIFFEDTCLDNRAYNITFTPSDEGDEEYFPNTILPAELYVNATDYGGTYEFTPVGPYSVCGPVTIEVASPEPPSTTCAPDELEYAIFDNFQNMVISGSPSVFQQILSPSNIIYESVFLPITVPYESGTWIFIGESNPLYPVCEYELEVICVANISYTYLDEKQIRVTSPNPGPYVVDVYYPGGETERFTNVTLPFTFDADLPVDGSSWQFTAFNGCGQTINVQATTTTTTTLFCDCELEWAINPVDYMDGTDVIFTSACPGRYWDVYKPGSPTSYNWTNVQLPFLFTSSAYWGTYIFTPKSPYAGCGPITVVIPMPVTTTTTCPVLEIDYVMADDFESVTFTAAISYEFLQVISPSDEVYEFVTIPFTVPYEAGDWLFLSPTGCEYTVNVGCDKLGLSCELLPNNQVQVNVAIPGIYEVEIFITPGGPTYIIPVKQLPGIVDMLNYSPFGTWTVRPADGPGCEEVFVLRPASTTTTTTTCPASIDIVPTYYRAPGDPINYVLFTGTPSFFTKIISPETETEYNNANIPLMIDFEAGNWRFYIGNCEYIVYVPGSYTTTTTTTSTTTSTTLCPPEVFTYEWVDQYGNPFNPDNNRAIPYLKINCPTALVPRTYNVSVADTEEGSHNYGPQIFTYANPVIIAPEDWFPAMQPYLNYLAGTWTFENGPCEFTLVVDGPPQPTPTTTTTTSTSTTTTTTCPPNAITCTFDLANDSMEFNGTPIGPFDAIYDPTNFRVGTGIFLPFNYPYTVAGLWTFILGNCSYQYDVPVFIDGPYETSDEACATETVAVTEVFVDIDVKLTDLDLRAKFIGHDPLVIYSDSTATTYYPAGWYRTNDPLYPIIQVDSFGNVIAYVNCPTTTTTTTTIE